MTNTAWLRAGEGLQRARGWTGDRRTEGHTMTGPMIYGHVLRYQVTGVVADDVPDVLARVLPALAGQPDLLTYLRRTYPGSRLEDYREVARTVGQELCAEDEDARPDA